MPRYDVDDIYRSLYFFELDRRDKLLARVQIASGLHLAVFAPFVYMLRNFSYEANPALLLYFVVCSLAYVSIAGHSIKYLVTAFWGHTYSCMGFPEKIEKYYRDLVAYHKYYLENPDAEKPDPSTNVEADFDEYLKSNFVACTTHNMEINDMRAEALHECVKYFFNALLPLFIAGAIFIFGDLDVTSKR